MKEVLVVEGRRAGSWMRKGQRIRGGLYTSKGGRGGISGMFVLCRPRGYPELFASGTMHSRPKARCSPRWVGRHGADTTLAALDPK